MNYRISQEQELLKQTINELAQSEIVPFASKIDWESSVPKNLASKLPTFGLFGITIPQEFGGVGADFLSLVIATEELSKASGSLGAQVSFHNAVVAEALIASANSSLRSKLLPRLAAGQFGAFSFSQRPGILCKLENGRVILNGAAEYVMSATSAGVYLVLAKTVDRKNVIVSFARDEANIGISLMIGAPKKLLGMRASDTANIGFHN